MDGWEDPSPVLQQRLNRAYQLFLTRDLANAQSPADLEEARDGLLRMRIQYIEAAEEQRARIPNFENLNRTIAQLNRLIASSRQANLQQFIVPDERGEPDVVDPDMEPDIRVEPDMPPAVSRATSRRSSMDYSRDDVVPSRVISRRASVDSMSERERMNVDARNDALAREAEQRLGYNADEMGQSEQLDAIVDPTIDPTDIADRRNFAVPRVPNHGIVNAAGGAMGPRTQPIAPGAILPERGPAAAAPRFGAGAMPMVPAADPGRVVSDQSYVPSGRNLPGMIVNPNTMLVGDANSTYLTTGANGTQLGRNDIFASRAKRQELKTAPTDSLWWLKNPLKIDSIDKQMATAARNASQVNTENLDRQRRFAEKELSRFPRYRLYASSDHVAEQVLSHRDY